MGAGQGSLMQVEAMTIVANLLDAVDMIRLFATRDNIYPPGNNPAGYENISQWVAYKEYVGTRASI